MFEMCRKMNSGDPQDVNFEPSKEEALQEIKAAIDLWLETAEKEHREIPKPRGRELLKALLEEAV